jgi:hypothetical protein
MRKAFLYAKTMPFSALLLWIYLVVRIELRFPLRNYFACGERSFSNVLSVRPARRNALEWSRCPVVVQMQMRMHMFEAKLDPRALRIDRTSDQIHDIHAQQNIRLSPEPSAVSGAPDM